MTRAAPPGWRSPSSCAATSGSTSPVRCSRASSLTGSASSKPGDSVDERDPPSVTVSPEYERCGCLERLLSSVGLVGLFEDQRDDSCLFPVAGVKVARLRVDVADRVAQL